MRTGILIFSEDKKGNPESVPNPVRQGFSRNVATPQRRVWSNFETYFGFFPTPKPYVQTFAKAPQIPELRALPD